MNKERLIKIINIVLDIIIVIIIAIIFFKNNKKETSVEENNEPQEITKNFVNIESETIKQEQLFEDLSFNDTYFSIDKENKAIQLSVRITNKGNNNYRIDGFVALLYDKNNRLLDTVSSFSYTFLGPNESQVIIIEDDIDLTDVDRIVYKPTYTKEAL